MSKQKQKFTVFAVKVGLLEVEAFDHEEALNLADKLLTDPSPETLKVLEDGATWEVSDVELSSDLQKR